MSQMLLFTLTVFFVFCFALKDNGINEQGVVGFLKNISHFS